jgi:hypothetical protein
MARFGVMMSSLEKSFRDAACRVRRVFACALVLVGVLVPAVGLADMRLKMGNDVVLVIASGDFDTETYNGWFTEVSVFRRGQFEAKMDRIDVRSRKLADSGMIHIDRLEVKNFVTPRQVRIGALVVENMRLKEGGAVHVDAWNDAASMMAEGFSLHLADMMAEGDGFTMDLGLVELAPLSWSSLPSGQRFLGTGAVGFSGLKITPKDDSVAMFRDEEVAALMGGENLLVSGNFSQHAVFDAGQVIIASSGRVDFEALGGVAYDIQVQTSERAAEAALRAADTPKIDIDRQIAERLLGDTAIIAASVAVRDGGLRPRLVQRAADEGGMSVDAALETAMQKVSQALTALFPSEGARLSAGVERFLSRGGTLQVAMRPAVPIPLSNLPAFLMLPDAAVRQLNVTAAQVD